MLPIRLLWIAAALAAPPSLAAPDTVAAVARAVTREVNGALATLESTTFRSRRPDVAYDSEIRAWRDASGVRKVEATDLDDSGSVVTEYYYRDGDLVFAYVAIKGWQGAREVTRVEHRQYFRDGAMTRWLAGMDKVARAPDDPDYAGEARTRHAAAMFFHDAATSAFNPPAAP
ncbi:MAG: hypothetical protein LW860_13120 [Xanthomonadaceae bacterium]|jgi:hypothetical protein|nr:hypothetical protein [Xanthomonadaceae bacterium]